MNRCRPLMFATLAALAVLGCSDTASAQPQLIVTPATRQTNPLLFSNIPSGGVSPSQAVSVTTADMTMATVILQVNPASTWLEVTPGQSVNTPISLSVKCNTTNLTAGSYNGSFTITVDGAPADYVTVYVGLTVSGISELSATPPSLSFTAQAGASTATPNGTQVQILSSGVELGYTLQATTDDGHNWLLLSTTQGSTGGPAFTVSVNPSTLSATQFPAIFQGLITATSTTSADSVIISVQLTLNSTSTLSVTPATPPPFLYQVGAADPVPQQLAVAASGGSTSFTIQESPPVSWLVLSALGGTAGSTPTLITLSATPYEQGLQPGTYTTNLIVTPDGEAALAPVPITLVVAAHPLIQLSTNSLAFTAQFAGSAPAAQTVMVTTSGGSVGFAVTSSASWLTATASASTTPATLTVQVNPSGLNLQDYTGTLTISPTNGDQYTETIAVSFSVSAAAQLVAGPADLLFSYETSQSPPQAQTVLVTSTGGSLAFTISTSTTTCGSNWLQATSNSATSNATLTISVVPTGLTAGSTCSGTVSLSYSSGLGPASVPILVTLAVSNYPELRVSTQAGFGVITAALGAESIQQQIALTSTDQANQVSYNAAIVDVSGGAWLGILGSTNGTTPQNLTIEITPGALTTPGTYTGTVVITSSSLGSAQFTIPVVLTVTTTTTVTVSPTSLSFSENQGGPLPAAQTLTLASSPGQATYTASIASITGGNWLQISPTSGNANGPIQVSVLANTLSQGDYPAQIALVFQGAATTATTVGVVLHVLAAQTVAVSPTSLSFSYQIGGTAPASQALSITSTAGAATVAVAASSGGWLSVSTTGGATPLTVNVSVNPQNLTAQTYTGSISITAAGVLATPISIPVSFAITSPPAPEPITIINNATGVAGVIAPGEEIAIKGSALGPASPAGGVSFQLNSSGGVSSTLAGVQVLFDSNPGTPIYVSADQIDVMVPYEINGRLSTTVVVMYNGVASAPFQLAVASAAPGLFTNNFTGAGQVAAVNQSGSYNGASGSGFAPAPVGSVISLYGTGGGQTSPTISLTGSVTPIPTSPSQLLTIPNVTAMVGGVPATVEFAGEAPGLVTGVMQVNILIPSNVTPGSAVPVTISIDGISSPTGTTIAVQ